MKDKQKAIEEAIQYVRDNKTWSDAEEEVAMEHMNHWRTDLANASSHIAEAIYDLMEEWSEENDMPENWWLELMDEDDIFWEL